MTTLMKPSTPTPQRLKPAASRQFTTVITLERTPQPVQILPEQSLAVFRPKTRIVRQPMRKLPPPNLFTAQHTGGWVSNISGQDLSSGDHIEIELPFGTPRFVNAVTLKLLLHGSKRDTLLKRMGHTWTICEDDLRVDLTDKTTQFRLGKVAVYS